MHLDTPTHGEKGAHRGLLKSMLVVTVLCSFGSPAHSLDIYQWVDEQGKTHMADVVPEKYRAKAKLVSYRKDNVGDTERQDAEARAAKTKSLLAPKQTDAVPQAMPASAPKPVELTQQQSCTQKWDAYYRSQECFAPYMIRFSGGSTIRPEAYEHCQEVKTPTMECEYDKRPSFK
ncbi:hypothetical protein os4_29650 [Comamonadaceae bacterium OS-4]|nr:hypothetical protein os4_29650 [Comamonadaceae bacterium OS-4]